MKLPKEQHEYIFEVLQKHYTSTQLTAERLAEYIGISVRHLNNICRTHYGKSPAKVIQCYRMEKALELYATIGENDFKCTMVGYDNIRTFNAIMKEYLKEHKR